MNINSVKSKNWFYFSIVPLFIFRRDLFEIIRFFYENKNFIMYNNINHVFEPVSMVSNAFKEEKAIIFFIHLCRKRAKNFVLVGVTFHNIHTNTHHGYICHALSKSNIHFYFEHRIDQSLWHTYINEKNSKKVPKLICI